MNVAARGPAGALGRGPAGSRRRAARPFEYGRRASMASLRIGEPPRSRARGPQGPFVQVLNCPPKRVRSTPPLVSSIENRLDRDVADTPGEQSAWTAILAR